MLSNKQLAEVKKFVKKVSKLKKEGSTTAGAPGYQTPQAFTGDPSGEGASDLKRITRATAYDIKAKKTRRHSVDLHEITYKEFKNDESKSTVKKVNESIIEINRRLREINRLLTHSSKLKTESSLDDTALWKKTNEALLKISDRMTEIATKTRQFADLKEIRTNAGVESVFKSAGLKATITKDSDGLHVDVDHFGEPVGFDIVGTKILDDRGEEIGDMGDSDIVEKLKGYFNA